MRWKVWGETGTGRDSGRSEKKRMLPEPPTKLNVTRRVFPFQGNRIVPPTDDVEMMLSAE